MESMSQGLNTRREMVLHNTKKGALVVLRTRHERCVDKFLVERNRTRSLVGFVVVMCEGLPLAAMNVYLIAFGCDYEKYYEDKYKTTLRKDLLSDPSVEIILSFKRTSIS